MSNQKPVWVVYDVDGDPVYVASWPEACHEHINDAITEHGLTEASKWVVRGPMSPEGSKT